MNVEAAQVPAPPPPKPSPVKGVAISLTADEAVEFNTFLSAIVANNRSLPFRISDALDAAGFDGGSEDNYGNW